jgi:hypothetical protein
MRICLIVLAAFAGLAAAEPATPQNAGTAGTLDITVLDPTGAAVANASISLSNKVTGFQRAVKSDASGTAKLTNVPPNQYHLEVTAPAFETYTQHLPVRGAVPIPVQVTLKLAATTEEVDVHSDAADILESVPTAHVDIDRSLFADLPRQSPGSGMSDVITQAAPGIAADSNGMFHPLGEHADTGYVFDNQPITDQQSKQFSNQMPLDIVQSFEVISGAPSAEYGDKAGLVVNAVTRSGLGANKPFGSLSASYGSFGTPAFNGTFGTGGNRFGEFMAFNTTRSGRYLDSPEYSPLHDIGNNEKFFNRVDFQPDQNDSLHLNLFLARTWFQIPNTWDQAFAGQDQRQRLLTYNIAPGWVHTFNPSMVLTFNPYVRQDQVSYYPSRDPFADLPATVAQHRRLMDLGMKTDLSYVKSHHNMKFGVEAQRYFLRESFDLGITDPAFNAVCVNGQGQAVTDPSITDPAACAGAGFTPNPAFEPSLLPFDLTRGGSMFHFNGQHNIDQVALYAQDAITYGGFTANVGLRWDWYSGLVRDTGLQPRIGLSYLIKPTSTVLRVSYSRFFETPYNENLIISSSTGIGGLASIESGSFGESPLRPGRRDQYNAGFQQGIAKRFVIDADYFWKFTQNAFDFDTLFNSPIQFPIEWRKSKIDGLAIRVNLTPIHGFSAYTAMGHTRARFFGPENGGILFNSPLVFNVFRIDHDQAFEQTTNLRYQHGKEGWWGNFTWRYDSGMVVGAVSTVEDAIALTPYEQTTIGFYCGSQVATPTAPITSCPSGVPFGAKLVNIPATGTFDPDHNPARVAPRNLFDVGIGNDNLLRSKDSRRWTLQFSVVNLTNKVALYNFLSTFSGTHFVTPRTYRVEIGYVF